MATKLANAMGSATRDAQREAKLQAGLDMRSPIANAWGAIEDLLYDTRWLTKAERAQLKRAQALIDRIDDRLDAAGVGDDR